MRRYDQTKRRLCIGAFAVVAAPVVLGSVAFACTNLANLQANPTSGAAGTTIKLTGSNYKNDATAGPVEIRMDSRTGPVLATLPTSSINNTGRTISVDVPIPASAALGDHTMIASQTNVTTGAMLSGLPVRANYKVTAAASSGRVAGVAPAAETAADPAAAATPAAAVASAPLAATPAVPTAALPLSPAVLATTAVAPAPVAPVLSGPAVPQVGTIATPVPVDGATAPLVAATTSATRSETVAVAPPAATVSEGLLPAVAGHASTVVPTMTLAFGLGIVLLSLLAFVKSGRNLVGRRLNTLA